MANTKKLNSRRKSVRNIRKITKTMELIATAQFKRAMDRSVAINAYERRIVELVGHLTHAGIGDVVHPLLEEHKDIKHTRLLVLTSNRGLCGGYNSSVMRVSTPRIKEMHTELPDGFDLEVSGKRGINFYRFRGVKVTKSFTNFEDKPQYEEVIALANRYIEDYLTGKIDRLEIVYTKFVSMSKQEAVRKVLLPMTHLLDTDDMTKFTVKDDSDRQKSDTELKKEAIIRSAQSKLAKSASKDGSKREKEIPFEFYPSVESIMEEAALSAFKVRLFKCFLDAAVSEQIARMVAMKAANDNAQKMIDSLGRAYNRARQGKITSELTELVGGAEALS
ncbi:MAG: ATP synthase F1 subunit gamma [Planctomycetaceae bacterium]|jgi:F-type H+-transporting ATPase subunit gamma|nr:ATP synthase F1 subunit gamma [Planctomycetaceae bacterium]